MVCSEKIANLIEGLQWGSKVHTNVWVEKLGVCLRRCKQITWLCEEANVWQTLEKKHVVNSDKEGMYTHFDEYVYRYNTIGDIILSKDYLKIN